MEDEAWEKSEHMDKVLSRDEANTGEDHDSADSDDSDEDRKPISGPTLNEIAKFEDSFSEVTRQYRIIDRIGEGTFSTVYKAEDLRYDQHRNDWDLQSSSPNPWISPPLRRRGDHARRKPKFVALKKIYVTSSPMRILNELELLNDLRCCKGICPLITAFRNQDQVVAVLPYYRHQDFRDYFRNMKPPDIRAYLRSLFTGLAAVHKAHILHRDIKPTNFLYDYRKQHGVLVDFGLAERESTDSNPCLCSEPMSRRKTKVDHSYVNKNGKLGGYPRHDTRPSRRANRAGTRGFRAPEVLFKCTDQSTKIDVWSVGVILLTILGRRFPFFNSTDDIDATIEIASIFGKRRMEQCALLHGAVFECTLPTVGERGFSFPKLIVWSDCRTNNGPELSDGERQAIQFMETCLELDPRKRISAEEALQHDFLLGDETQSKGDEVDDNMDMVAC